MENPVEFRGLPREIINSLPESMARAMRKSGVEEWDLELFQEWCRIFTLDSDAEVAPHVNKEKIRPHDQ